MEGFFYPNEAEIQWSILIVLYPYITGLVAGAFITSSLYHVFGVTRLRPVAKFSLLVALAFLLVAPLPLLAHLGQPLRGFEIFFTPHFTSAMAGFGYIWLFYLILLLLEIWFVFRADIVRYARKYSGDIRGVLYYLLALGVLDDSERSVKLDHRISKVLATIGIPSACFLHGYVGFIFGAIKANPWWSTPLMPVIFLLSAIVSGIAILIVLYMAISKLRRQPIDHECLHALARYLFGFLVIDVSLEGLEIVNMMYEAEESWEIINQLVTGKLFFSYFFLQFMVGSLLPLIVLAQIGQFRGRLKESLILTSALLVLSGVFAMRWNVVIGGQLLSKSFLGFLSYTPVLLGREGIFTAAALMALPFIALAVFLFLLPPWEEQPAPAALTPS